MKKEKQSHWWEREPWRMIQTNLRETDMRDLDAAAYVKQMEDFNATVAMLSFGGIQANYETRLADHPINPYLGETCLKEVVDLCHSRGIRVIARVDFSKIHRDVYERHPQWAYRTAEGNIVDYNGNIHACLCGGFQQKKAFEIVAEIIENFDVDGFFINMGGFPVTDYSYHYYGICHCRNCQNEFMRRFHLDLPEKEDMEDPVYRKYVRFKQQIVTEYQERMGRMIHRMNPEIAVEGMDFIRLESNTEYGRAPWVYDSSSTVRSVQSLTPEIRCSNPTVDYIGYFYRHVAVSKWQQELRLWQTTANFGLLDYYIMGLLDRHSDCTGYEAVKKVFAFGKQWENLFRGMRQEAKVLLISQGGYAKSKEGKGWVRALTEGHILFHEAMPEKIRDVGDLHPYQAVILAGVAMCSKRLTEAADAYVSEGGTLIVSGMTGIYMPDGEESEQLPFGCMKNAGITERSRDMISAMFLLNREEREWFPLIRETELLFFGEEYLEAEYDESAQKFFRLIPPHFYGPPELCYYTSVMEKPGLVRIPYGKGQTLHIPWNAGALYADEGYENTFGFLQGVLKRIAHLTDVEDEPFSRMVEVTVGRNSQGNMLVQLVNGTGFFGNSFFAPVPVNDIRVHVPLEQRPRQVLSLTGENVEYDWDGQLHLRVNCPNMYEGIYIEV